MDNQSFRRSRPTLAESIENIFTEADTQDPSNDDVGLPSLQSQPFIYSGSADSPALVSDVGLQGQKFAPSSHAYDEDEILDHKRSALRTHHPLGHQRTPRSHASHPKNTSSSLKTPDFSRASSTPAVTDEPESKTDPVMFTLGSTDIDAHPSSDQLPDNADHPDKKKRGRHRGPSSGDIFHRSHSTSQDVKDIIAKDEDYKNLKEVDIDDLASHRLNYVGCHPAHKVSHHKVKIQRPSYLNKPYNVDHTPHDVFVELDELYQFNDGNMEWKETARWIKFEEDVEQGGRWGKPHVSSLSFHSLLELRRLLEHGVSLFDMDEDTVPGICKKIAMDLKNRNIITADEARQLERALLLKHRHRDDEGIFHTVMSSSTVQDGLKDDSKHDGSHKRKSLSQGIRHSFAVMRRESLSHELADFDVESNYDDDEAEPRVNFHQGSRNNSIFFKPGISKRIPPNSEGANVWVGSASFLRSPIMVFARLARGCYLGDVTEVPIPVRFIFIFMGPKSEDDILAGRQYHEIGRAISTMMSYPKFHRECYVALNRSALIRSMNEFLDESLVLPAGEWERKNLLPVLDSMKEQMRELKKTKAEKMKEKESKEVKESKDEDGLERTGSLFGGVVNDIKRRYPLYLSDIKDGLNSQCFSAAIFIFFAALSPAITFGADIEQNKVNRWMGVTETIVGSTIAGLIFSIFSGQPLLITGTTGPLVVFEQSFYDMATTNRFIGEEYYMAFRSWVGVWVLITALIVVAFDLSFFLKYFTRFIEEIFTMLVSIIFIVSVIINLLKVVKKHPLTPDIGCLNVTVPQNFSFHSGNSSEVCLQPVNRISPNSGLLSIILTLGCFLIAYFLRIFRNSRFLGKGVRKNLGDFGVPIAILIMTLVDKFLLHEDVTAKLTFPKSLEPTRSADGSREWLINPKLEYWWLVLLAPIPAVLVFFLMFIETQIAGRIINKKENKLHKGPGFHLNILCIGVIGLISGVLGCPWVCVATVRSVTHVGALTLMSRSHAPGERAHVEVVWEQRLSNFAVHILMGMSLLLKPILSYVPHAVLYGVFLYMGVASLGSLQFFERCKLFFMPKKHYPDVPYIKKIQLWKLHLFTITQIVMVGILWIVKETPASLFFPFFLVVLVPFRLFVIPFIYTQRDLQALDSEFVANDEDNDEDMYVTAHMPM